jgi:hypothetical protein
MAKVKQVIEIMVRGQHAFNQWPADNAKKELDLSGADLRGLNFDQMCFAVPPSPARTCRGPLRSVAARGSRCAASSTTPKVAAATKAAVTTPGAGIAHSDDRQHVSVRARR